MRSAITLARARRSFCGRPALILRDEALPAQRRIASALVGIAHGRTWQKARGVDPIGATPGGYFQEGASGHENVCADPGSPERVDAPELPEFRLFAVISIFVYHGGLVVMLGALLQGAVRCDQAASMTRTLIPPQRPKGGVRGTGLSMAFIYLWDPHEDFRIQTPARSARRPV